MKSYFGIFAGKKPNLTGLVVAGDTERSRKQVVRMRACVSLRACVCLCDSMCVQTRVWVCERVVHRGHAHLHDVRCAFTSYTHEPMTRTLRYAGQAWVACVAYMLYVRVWRKCVACVLSLRAWCEYNSCVACMHA